MEIIKKVKFILPLLVSINANAGFHNLTHHSRAHCINNESITWWAGHAIQSRIIAYHNKNGVQNCILDTFPQYTWRNAAVHWGEAPLVDVNDWNVYAYHILYYPNGMPYTAEITFVKNCDIYNGWWD